MPQPIDPAELEEWLAKLPPRVAEVARKYPPTTCYRSTKHAGWHYRIHSYEEPVLPTNPDAPITLKLVHGRDSTLPGICAFGMEYDHLVKCDCGKWEPPTLEQAVKMSEIVKAGVPQEAMRDRSKDN